jgi:AcrR family transcriptional regulator
MIDPPHTKRARATPPPSPAEMTRTALVRAALKLFGKQGFEGTSTREIAAAAKANIGSIAYHFGGKQGLRLAVADHIVETMQAIAGQAMGTAPAPGEAAATPEAAERQLLAALERMVAFMVARPEAGDIIQFMLREMAQPTAALDRINEGVFAPTHERICRIWEQATGEPAHSERTKLAVFTMIGQVLYFRIGREVVVRRMGWDGIGDAEAGKILDVARDNLKAVLAARTKEAGEKP